MNKAIAKITGDYIIQIDGDVSLIIFYDPKGVEVIKDTERTSLASGIYDAIAQQIDIMPTVLGYVGYDKPFVSFGCDLFATPADSTWAVNYLNGIYQYVRGDYMLRFNGDKTTGLYAFKTDSLLKTNIIASDSISIPDSVSAVKASMEKNVKAIIQQYMIRMTGDKLVIK